MANADRLIELFNGAKYRPTGTVRDAYLAEECGDDAALKAQVVSLVEAHENAGEFLRARPELSPEMEAEQARAKPEEAGERIGPYKLCEQIGEGGFGVVWVAEQQMPVRRRVALKIIKMGMDTREVVARFEQERQALAMMDHPNIAKVFDAGATEHGRPFFVMELVHGIRITDYCDQANLPTAERLALFIQVCHAVQHAHQKGIIHRDLKPSNILVTLHDGVAVPKVIDFGVAKATQGRLGDFSIYTQFRQMIGTPLYMSPEQAEMSGLDVDTRTDIYALGVLLYELLTGRSPFDEDALLKAGYDEMRRIIREQEPQKPSTALHTMAQDRLTAVAHHRASEPPKLIHAIRGDLDWIVMKTLEKDRARRYDTANGLAADVRRHLDNEPVIARPPSTGYRFQKLVRRNKLAFAAASAVAAALIIGLGLSTWLFFRERAALEVADANARRAEQQAERAEAEATKSRQVAQFMKDMFKGVGPGVARGRDLTLLREILDQTTRRLNQDLAGQPEVEADLRDTLGVLYRDLRDYQNAAAMHEGALAIREKLHGRDHPAVAASLNGLGQVLLGWGQYEAAGELFREALEIQKRHLGDENTEVARTLHHLGSLLRRSGKLEEAEPPLLESLAIRRKLFGNENEDVAETLHNLGLLLRLQKTRLAEAESVFREALAIRRIVLGNGHSMVVDTLVDLGRTLEMEGEIQESVIVSREALAIMTKAPGPDDPQLLLFADGLAKVLRRLNKKDDAEVIQRLILRVQTELLGGKNRDVIASARLLAADILSNQKMWGQAVDYSLHNQKLRVEAEEILQEALKNQRLLLGSGHNDLQPTLVALARVLNDQDKLPAAESAYREALVLTRDQFGGDHKFVGELFSEMAVVLVRKGEIPKAEAAHRDALSIGRRLLGTGDSSPILWLERLAALLHQQGRSEEAEKLFEEMIAYTQKSSKDADLVLGKLFHSFAEFSLYKANKPAKAVELYLKALPIRRTMYDDDLAWTLHHLGYALRLMGKAKEAEPYLRESIMVFRMPGTRTPDASGWVIEELVGALSDQGKLVQAEAAARELVDLRKKQHGGVHREVEVALATLAQLLQGQRKLEEAAVVWREELAVERKLLGGRHPYVANSLLELASVLRDSGKSEDAETAFREALEILWGNPNGFAPESLSKAGEALSKQGKHDKAEAVYREAVDLQRRFTVDEFQFEGDEPQLAFALAEFAGNLVKQEKYAAAEAPARECLTLYKKNQAGGPQITDARRLLAESLLGQKKYDDAEPLLLTENEELKQELGRMPDLVVAKQRLEKNLQDLVRLYQGRGETEKAEEWSKKLAELRKKEPGK